MHDGWIGLPAYFFTDLLVFIVFGLLLVIFIGIGCKFVDWLWRQLDLEDQIQKGNIAAGIVMAAVIFGLCYALSTVVAGILG